ncbi:hypothetical protein PISMIDRAFT_211050 [Pisolithus microcarpus 441]|uniref:Uncharacterized protein n=1 Tax=Pisolithus microcarpus 441 TaxID=765257 RepID=A0A0C9YM98_9AGAM|nr:hypothetical protein PISMIDRAFT_211050 [Pisolithus microcarpus 441]
MSREARPWLGQLGRDSGDFWSKNSYEKEVLTSRLKFSVGVRSRRQSRSSEPEYLNCPSHRVPSALVVVPFFPLPIRCIQTNGATETKPAMIFDPSLWGLGCGE